MAATVHGGKGASDFSVGGATLKIEQWTGSAPGELHVHHSEDIAWHVLEGILSFRFEAEVRLVTAGETLFVPAGTPHSYGEGDARYLVIAPPRLFELFLALRGARMGRPHTEWGKEGEAEIYQRFDSTLLDLGPGRPLE